MATEAQNHNTIGYEQALVQIMREHDLIFPGEEEQITNYLLITA